jgi:hypothetical protein
MQLINLPACIFYGSQNFLSSKFTVTSVLYIFASSFCEIYRQIFLKGVFQLSLSWFSISKSGFLHLNFIGLLQCNKILSVINSMDWERIIRAGKPPQYFEFGPSSQDPFSFCQIQLALNTVLTITPIVNCVVCYPLPLHKERGGVGKISLLVEHICIYLIISKTTNRKRESREGLGESWPYSMSFNRHFMEHAQPHAWADFNSTL